MKTYAECEQTVDRELRRAMVNWDGLEPSFRTARELGFLKAKCVVLAYENELLRDKANTAEMHQLLERMGGK